MYNVEIAKRAYQVAEVTLAYSTQVPSRKRVFINRSQVSADVLRQVWDPASIELNEEVKVMLLSRSNRLLGVLNHTKGGQAGTIVDCRSILVAALKAKAEGIILAHNHPSGNMVPSFADKQMTSDLKKGCDYVGIKLLDHIIIAPHPEDGHFSFADEGML